MQQLFRFIFRNRSLFTFLLLLCIGLFLVFRFNEYPGAVYFHTSNRVSGRVLEYRQSVTDYLELKQVNTTLAQENARLREHLLNPVHQSLAGMPLLLSSENLPDQYELIPAKVINNSWTGFRNYITLNQGSYAGLEPGMAVIGSHGVVGQVQYVSRHYATVVSLLHSGFNISSTLTSTRTTCTVNWPGQNPRQAKVRYLPLNVAVAPGDTVVTSGYNAVFPADTHIGTVASVSPSDDANFLDVTLDLATDFQSLRHVYVIRNTYLAEQDSLQVLTNPSL